jgi:hypothetical protein
MFRPRSEMKFLASPLAIELSAAARGMPLAISLKNAPKKPATLTAGFLEKPFSIASLDAGITVTPAAWCPAEEYRLFITIPNPAGGISARLTRTVRIAE